MSVGHWIKRMQADDDGSVREVAHVTLDTPFLLEYAEEMCRHDDPPDDATVEWLEPFDYDAELESDDCFDPDAVLKSLKWLQRLTKKKTKDNQAFWEGMERSTHRAQAAIAFSPRALGERCARDLDALIGLCEDASKAGQLIVHVVVP